MHRISDEGIHETIGVITLKDGMHGLTVIPDLRDIEPGRHAFHIHESGDCGPGFSDGEPVAELAAGPYYGHDSHRRHNKKPAGDLPEIVAGADGLTTEAVMSAHLSVSEIAGRSILVHAHSEAPGAGHPVACGVIPGLE